MQQYFNLEFYESASNLREKLHMRIILPENDNFICPFFYSVFALKLIIFLCLHNHRKSFGALFMKNLMYTT